MISVISICIDDDDLCYFYVRHITERTNGTFAVASDAAHLSDLLQAHTVPPPELQHKGN